MKNLILLTIDALRADHVGCLGYPERTTPNMDEFAKEGVVFTQAFANGSGTAASFPSILTSTYQSMFGDLRQPLSKQRTTIAQALRAHGYSTAAFHSNPYLSSYFNYNRGFDYFEDFQRFPLKLQSPSGFGIRKILYFLDATLPFKKLVAKLPILRNIYVDWQLNRNLAYQKGEVINENALSWLANNENNFFLWLHFMDPHPPYRPPKEFLPERSVYWKGLFGPKTRSYWKPFMSENEVRELVRGKESLYDGEIRYVDNLIGQLFIKLKETGVWQNSFIIITADHGEEFMEHGGFGHGHTLYDEVLHVPLIIGGPGVKEDVLVDDLVSLIDLGPTILDLLEIEGIPHSFMGRSLFPALKGGKLDRRTEVISEAGAKRLSYRTHKWKYIFVLNGEIEHQELYDLQEDPREKQNVAHKEKSLCKRFRLRLSEHTSRKKRVESMIREKTKISQKIKSLKKAGKI